MSVCMIAEVGWADEQAGRLGTETRGEVTWGAGRHVLSKESSVLVHVMHEVKEEPPLCARYYDHDRRSMFTSALAKNVPVPP